MLSPFVAGRRAGNLTTVADDQGDDGRLQRVQQLQYEDRAAAEALMLLLVREVYAADVTQIELRPSPISLNSIHGFLIHADGRCFFFKTHTETDTVIAEYYRAQQIADAGYPVIQPLFRSSAVGKQLLVYERIDNPSVFDVAWAIERGQPLEAAHEEDLQQAQTREEDALWRRYRESLRWQNAEAAASAPIHQLFHHRLTGGRYARFYDDDCKIGLSGESLSYAELRERRWQVNGQQYNETLTDIVARCLRLLEPAQPGPAIIGHGDAHNGNVFLRAGRSPHLMYFDPAFAGAHHPLLDLAKPVFHNVFAMWMYFPHEMRARLRVGLRREANVLVVSYENALHPVRELFFHNKLERVLRPALRELRGRGWLREDWRAYFKAALACCPLLTLNLADRARFPAEISLLGFAMTMEMGAESAGKRSRIDLALDEAAAALDA